MDETSQAVQAFLFKMGFRQAQSEQPSYWVRTVDDLTRQAMTMAIGYVQGETLFSLWIEKLDLFQKYLQRDEVSMLNVVRVNLAKNGLYRIGESGRRGWTARDPRPQ